LQAAVVIAQERAETRRVMIELLDVSKDADLVLFRGTILKSIAALKA
jgi:hypothetical protein